jgi:hypothetical protein
VLRILLLGNFERLVDRLDAESLCLQQFGSCPAGGLVLDPFCGSGSSALPVSAGVPYCEFAKIVCRK